MTRLLFTVLLLFALAPAALAELFNNNIYKVETIGALTDAKVAEAVRAALSDKGVRVVGKDGKPVCEIWFRKEIPTQKAEVSGANFGQIPEGAFIGVINFPNGGSDYRGQGIKAGYYTLRFGLILQDGAHLGVSPARDFFLLGPVADDKDPNAVLKPEDNIKQSKAASGTGHPSPWAVVPASSEKDLPKVATNEEEHAILEIKLPTKGGEAAIGLVIVGKTEG